MYLALFVTTTILLCGSRVFVDGEWKGSWSMRAAKEAEAIAAEHCSGHGRAYLDGLVLLNGHYNQTCECNSCYGGSDCSELLSDCEIDVDSGDPLFLEPFWMKHAESSAILISGWHRMGYTYSDRTVISELLVNHILKVHDIVGNAVTEGRYILFGSGSTQLLNAAVHALSPNSSSSVPPAEVVVTAPYYPFYRIQTEIFNSVDYRLGGDTSLWKNNSDNNESIRFIEFVTSPNNPDGKLNKAVLNGPNVRTIYDHAYYWPHFTAIPAPSDEDLMIFSISKLTGHAGTRFGWAIIKDEEVYKKMMRYVIYNTIGVSRDVQLRALKLLDVVLDQKNGNEIFEFGYTTLTERWMRLNQIMSKSIRFSLQKLDPQYCSFLKSVRDPSPAFAWLKCERKEDENCYEVLKEAHINGRRGSVFGVEDRFLRLSLCRSQDNFEILIHYLEKLVSEELASQQMHQIECD